MRQKKVMRTFLIVGIVFSGLVGIGLTAQQNKDTVKVPGGLALSEFKGYEGWSVIAISQNGGPIAAIPRNPGIIDAYRASVLYSRATHYAVSRS